MSLLRYWWKTHRKGKNAKGVIDSAMHTVHDGVIRTPNHEGKSIVKPFDRKNSNVRRGSRGCPA